MKKLSIIPSPLVVGALAKRVGIISGHHIIDQYKKVYHVDVSDYYSGLDGADIFQCSSTGYRFYYPFSLAGRESLYRQLEQTLDGAYKEDKWEYNQALSMIKPSSRLLDVGCGKGAFVRKAGQAGSIAVGLELNSESAAEARARGLDVRNEMVGDHAEQHTECYDFVCSFQVLEHIADVRKFLTDCLVCLRPGGTLILGVPNNAGFVGMDQDAVLNMPPHHMGLWTKDSLSALAKLFPIELKGIRFEPLQEVDWYASVMERRAIPSKKVRSIYYRLGGAKIFREWVNKRKDSIHGHTVMAVFRKASQ
jgi:2-polyprenyl-3-methyl-5-hydroxy-6-metoxy-1,4-benzoquinol methylase